MKKLIGIVLAAGIVVAAPAVATAAEEGTSRCGLSAGAYFPTDMSDAIGSVGWQASLTYDVAATEKATHRVSLGWAQAPGDSLTIGGVKTDFEYRTVPFGYTYIRTPMGPGRGFYYGGGAGVYVSTFKAQSAGSPGVKSEAIDGGVHLVAGYALSKRMGVELRWDTLTKDYKHTAGGTTVNLDNADSYSLTLTGAF